MTNLQIFAYNGNNIAFDFGNGNKMINATQMAKAFGKTPYEFSRLPSTINFIEVLERKSNTGKSLITQRGNSERAGTWMHEKLALKFAAWLSPEFELWVYEKIEELLRTGQTSLKSLEETLLNPDTIIKLATSLKEAQEKLKSKQEQLDLAKYHIEVQKELNELQEKSIAKQAPKVEYHDKVLLSNTTHTMTVIAAHIGKSAKWANQALKKMDFHYRQGDAWILKAKYKGHKLAITKTHPYTDSDGKQQTKLYMVYTEKGRKVILELLQKYIELTNPSKSN